MKNIEEKIINTLRILSVDMIENSNSGHPGLPLGAAPIAYTLWFKHLKHNPKNPNWLNRDRFILSAGHGSALLYSLLYLFQYGLTIDDLKQFRKLNSLTPGHPEYKHTIGVEVTTGPLGQGIANGVGMAMAESYLAENFNKKGLSLVDHYTYVLCGDGCLQEGISSEACSLAGTLGLGKLIILYDSNNITIEGNTNISFNEDILKRFSSYNWHTLFVEDGNDINMIDKAIKEAKNVKDKPSIIKIKTKIGFGSPNKEGTAMAHGEPLGKEELKLTKRFFNFNEEKCFNVDKDIYEYMQNKIEKLNFENEKWNNILKEYKKIYKESFNKWNTWNKKEIEYDILKDKDFWKEEEELSTREYSGIIINKLSKKIENLIGGSADLAPSTKTIMKNRHSFSKNNRLGSNLHFGVREHAMGGIANGIYLHGGLRPYISSFFVFSDYMKPAMRLSSIMKIPIINILTHDSIGVGEDGPTHQPIEQLATFRSMPNFTIIRPCDYKETAAAWYLALTRVNSPTGIILTRQKLPKLKKTSKEAIKGAYILEDSEKNIPDILLMATGSEVHLICKAKDILKQKNIDARVISMPSFEIFEEQPKKYKEYILPKNIRKRIAVESASSFGWNKYTGLDGHIISIDNFGLSGKGEELFKHFNITVENIVNSAINLINK